MTPFNAPDLTKMDHTPVLFVPGAMCGGWIWENNFAAYFREKGFDTRCMTFSSHGRGLLARSQISLDRYIAECSEAISEFDTPPVVIAHSLGGLVALHAMQQVRSQALVLMSPAPIDGALPIIRSLGVKSPVSMFKFLSAMLDARVTRLGSPPVGVYSDTSVPEASRSVTANLKSESIQVMLKLLAPPKLDTQNLKVDNILCIAATGDMIIPEKAIRKTAKSVNADFRLYQGLSHTYQVEQSWSDIARDIESWLNTKGATRH